LVVKEKVLGVLTFLTREEHQFSADEIEFLTTLAHQRLSRSTIPNSMSKPESSRLSWRNQTRLRDELLAALAQQKGRIVASQCGLGSEIARAPPRRKRNRGEKPRPRDASMKSAKSS
jgi:signal transduction protein with GAF and PtsI domain